MRDGLAGTYRFEAWPALEIVVTPSFIRDQAGQGVEVRGVADPARPRLVEEENARSTPRPRDDGRDEDDDDDEDDEDEEATTSAGRDRLQRPRCGDDRARARLAPDDDETSSSRTRCCCSTPIAPASPGRLDALLARAAGIRTADPAQHRDADGQAWRTRGSPRSLDSRCTSRRDLGESTTDDDASTMRGSCSRISATRSSSTRPIGSRGSCRCCPTDVNLLVDARVQGDPGQAADAGARDRTSGCSTCRSPTRATSARTTCARSTTRASRRTRRRRTTLAVADRGPCAAVRAREPVHLSLGRVRLCRHRRLREAFEQVKLAVAHDYDHLGKVEVDADLGPILEWPEFKALFRDWHARQEGN